MSDDSIPTFAQLDLAPAILKAVQEVGYETPSPIQAKSIPLLLEGRDLLGLAQTGTGKTAAFALPLLSRIDSSLQSPQLLVLAPTRELAIQVAEAMQTYGRHMPGFHVLPIYGGQPMGTQLRMLKRGVQVVVGTPGRVQDHLRRGSLDLSALRAVVLDEADEMLRMGFIDDVEEILEKTPTGRQVALFSATMPEAIRRIAHNQLTDPVEIKIKSKTATVERINQRYWQVSGLHKLDALTRILEVEGFDAMLIFVRTKSATEELAEKLEARGYASSALNGDMNQQMREKTVEKLKRGTLDIIVATDVAARGLDVERISHVVNYDIPHDTEAYVHRIGRTGRAGRKGEAILFVAPRENRMLRAIEKATRQPIEPMQLPSREDVTDKRVAGFKQKISEVLEAQSLTFFEELVEGYAAEHNTGLAEVAAALAFMVQQERPLLPDEREVKSAKSKPKSKREPREFDKRGDRPRQHERGERPERSERQTEEGMVTYRVEVGRDDGVEPKNLVGAIANEAGIESRYIGHIKIFDDFSLIDLPDGMPKEVASHLRRVWVCGKPLKLTFATPGSGRAAKGKKADRGAEGKRRKEDKPRPKSRKRDSQDSGESPVRRRPTSRE